MGAKKALATISLGADSKGLGRGLNDARKKLKSFGADTSKTLKKAFGGGKKLVGGAAGLLGKAGGMVGAGLGVQAGAGIVDMMGDVLGFEKNLTRLQIASGKTSTQMASLRQSILDTSRATGISSEEILSGTQTYVDLTGDIAGAEKAMSTFARVAQASGSSVSDVAQAASALKGAGIPIADLERTFSGFITQGKAGAVSLKDFAGELAGLAPRWAKFNESTTAEGISQLGAAFQIARQGFGSASEAANGLQATMGAISQNAKKFEQAGVKVFDKNPKTGVKTLRTFDQIMSSIEGSKLIKDPTLMTKALGSKEAEQTVTMLLKARQHVGGMASEYDKLVAAGMDAGAVQRDLATYQESASGKIEAAWNNVKIALAEAFTPERIASFAKALVGVAEILGKIVGYVEKGVEKIDEIRGDDSKKVERRSTELSDKWVSEAKNLTPDQKRTQGRALMQTYANYAQQETPSGQKGTTKDTYQEASRKAGQALLDQALVEGNNWEMSKLEDPVARKLENELMARDVGKALAAAIEVGFAGLPKQFNLGGLLKVNLDGTKVGEGVDNARGHRGGK